MRVAKLLALIGCCSLCCFGLYGCVFMDMGEFAMPSGPPSDRDIPKGYNQVELRQSSAADVLDIIHISEHELLSQSKSVVASQGQKKRKHKVWFKMVAFDENELTARRKYLFIEDERPKFLFTEPWAGFGFDSEMVLEGEVLSKPYSNENARRIAILKQVLENFRKDIDEVGLDNKKLATSGMMVNQALEAILVKLDSLPSLAARLNEPAGVEFDHISLNKGKIQMVVVGDVVTVKMRLGSFVHKFKKQQEEDT